uniref:Secreted protein n=1 Tax=Panagrellus redivivus TaxID=6233 RepID=A0A7E4UWE4_PANRE
MCALLGMLIPTVPLGTLIKVFFTWIILESDGIDVCISPVKVHRSRWKPGWDRCVHFAGQGASFAAKARLGSMCAFRGSPLKLRLGKVRLIECAVSNFFVAFSRVLWNHPQLHPLISFI